MRMMQKNIKEFGRSMKSSGLLTRIMDARSFAYYYAAEDHAENARHDRQIQAFENETEYAGARAAPGMLGGSQTGRSRACPVASRTRSCRTRTNVTDRSLGAGNGYGVRPRRGPFCGACWRDY